tara:strand:- start:42730 stop:43548 length:819 start_codon:yes stop_codon:yes gene_type:complete
MSERDPRRRAPLSAPASIETVATAAAIVDLLAEREEPLGVQMIADLLGMTKSRISRHMTNLESLGLVARGSSGRGFRLGWRTIRWGQIASSRMALAQILAEPLRAFNERSGRTVLLCAAAGGDAIVIQCLPAPRAFRIDVQTGLLLALPHSPTARVCYAFQPRETRMALIDHLRRREPGFRLENEAAFEVEVAAIQRRYHSWDANKFSHGYAAIAAPVFDRDMALIASVTVMLPSHEITDATPPADLVTALLACAENCSRQLGSTIRFPAAR